MLVYFVLTCAFIKAHMNICAARCSVSPGTLASMFVHGDEKFLTLALFLLAYTMRPPLFTSICFLLQTFRASFSQIHPTFIPFLMWFLFIHVVSCYFVYRRFLDCKQINTFHLSFERLSTCTFSLRRKIFVKSFLSI